MNERQSPLEAKYAVDATKDAVATYKIADRRSVFQPLEVDDLLALDRVKINGRAFPLSKGLGVYLVNSGKHEQGRCKLRIKSLI